MAIEGLTQTVVQQEGIGYTITVLIFAIVFNSLILWLLSKWFNFEKRDYKYALFIAVITSIASFALEYIIPVFLFLLLIPIGYLIEVLLIKYIYIQKWGKSLLVGLIWWILGMIIGSIIVFLMIALQILEI